MNFLKRNLLLLVISTLVVLASPFASAGSMTDYLETALINHLFRGTAYTAPSTLYVALHTSSCSDSAAGTEVSGGSYARVAVTSGTSAWAATSSGNGTTSNSSATTFPAPTANWGSLTYWSIFDASTSGNQLICAALGTPKTVNNGDAAPSFAAGSLTFQIDN
ncbi:MAG: hypothetical protein JWL63_3230 [Rhodocyclales bacterium]|nr:hypothetical protein [Rhodocyclales bacterium]